MEWTYKKLTQQIDAVDDYIMLIRNIQKDCGEDKDKVRELGGVIDALLCYKNYLKFDRTYVPADDHRESQGKSSSSLAFPFYGKNCDGCKNSRFYNGGLHCAAYQKRCMSVGRCERYS